MSAENSAGEDIWDAVVVGLGGVGSFALRSLVRREGQLGKSVLGLERFDKIGHSNGSSHGSSRLYRHAYFEHSDYVPLLQHSTEQFRLLEQQQPQYGPLLEPCGLLIIDHHDAEDGIFQSSSKSAAKYNLDVEVLDYETLVRRYPQFRFKSSHVGLLEKDGGYVRPERAIRAAVDDALAHGAKIRTSTQVLSIEERPDESVVAVTIQSDQSETELILANRVIVAGGAWATRLIPEWSSHLQVTRQIQGWFNVSSNHPTQYAPDQMPAWILGTSDEETHNLHIYGMPTDPYTEDHVHQIKVALHGRKNLIDNPDDNIFGSKEVTDDEANELQMAASSFLRAIDPPTTAPLGMAKVLSCMYTVSPDHNFFLGRPRGYQRTYAAAGLSGHGFKMVPALGHVLADLALRGTTDFSVDFLSPSRFDV